MKTYIDKLKEEIASLAGRGETEKAAKKLKELIYTDTSFLTVSFVNKAFSDIKRGDLPGFTYLKIGLVCNATIEPFDMYLKAEAFKYDLLLDIHIVDHYRYAEEIMKKESDLYCRDCGFFVFILIGEELNPGLYYGFDGLSADEKKENAQHTIVTIKGFIDKVKSFSKSPAIVTNLVVPQDAGIDYYQEGNRNSVFSSLNSRIYEMTSPEKGTYYFDFDRVTNIFGKDRYRDMKRWYLAKQPFSTSFMPAMSGALLRLILPIAGKNKKCLVLDLDNTLWGGIVGEDGMENISIGETPQGRAYSHFQREILSLYRKGIILAVNSKNNTEDALKVFDEHPDMILKREHFSAMKINWEDKADNIRSIAEELNIGTESMVFIDDSPEEKELVRIKLPEVLVPDMPEDPAGFVAALKALPVFDSLTITEEDRDRGRLYTEESKRIQAKKSFSDIDDFYRALEIKVCIGRADKFTIPRISQLTMKTNQFNLTTKRYSAEEVTSLSSSKDHTVLWLRSEDKYGSNGIVAVAIIKKDGPRMWHIDTFLMSCRVIGRTIEKAFLNHIISLAKDENVDEIRAEYIATAKNHPAMDFLKDNGFSKISEDGARSAWKQRVGESGLSCPDWIEWKIN